MSNLSKSIESALRTWYPVGHKLHFNPHHPLMKLIGEWGELLDDYAKSIYKPDYIFNPIDELGDTWYYLRILCYQINHIPVVANLEDFYKEKSIEYLISYAVEKASQALRQWEDNGFHWSFYLDISYSILLEIAGNRHNITLDQLTDSNWEKLKPGSERGDQWMRARIQTDD